MISAAGARVPTRTAPGWAARACLLGGLTVAAGSLVGYATMRVPVMAPVLLPAEARGHWALTVASVAVVAAVDAVWILLALRRRRAVVDGRGVATGRALTARHDEPWWAPARVLGPDVVGPVAFIVAGAISYISLLVSLIAGLELWQLGALALAPWIPLFAVEGLAKWRRHGLFALFMAVTLLQVMHMGEHTVQVSQLLLTDGDLARSHGVFGQLDFETVHFVWDTAVFLVIGLLVSRFAMHNRWLWICFIAASLHEVEHIYLFVVSRTDVAFYARGGFAGILGHGGVIGSPLYRPYQHFAYNFCVVVPLVVALWDQARLVQRTGSDT